jgi:hypothetical protein
VLAAPVTHHRAEAADDETGYPDAIRFDIFGIDARVADMRHGHGDDLFVVGRVGQDFLITGHGRVEDEFAGLHPNRAKAFAGESLSIFEREQSMHVCFAPHPCPSPTQCGCPGKPGRGENSMRYDGDSCVGATHGSPLRFNNVLVKFGNAH